MYITPEMQAWGRRKMRVCKLEWELSALQESMKAAGLEKHLRSGDAQRCPARLRLCVCSVPAVLRALLWYACSQVALVAAWRVL